LIPAELDLQKQTYLFTKYLKANKKVGKYYVFDNLCEELGLDVDIVDQIVDMLTILNKNEQKKILRRNVNGQY
jgi:chorismate mutase